MSLLIIVHFTSLFFLLTYLHEIIASDRRLHHAHTRWTPPLPPASVAPRRTPRRASSQLITYVSNVSYFLHFLVPWTQNITLGIDSTTLSSPQRTDLSLNVISLPGCFLKTSIDIMLVTLLCYVFTFLFLPLSSFIYSYVIKCLASCN